MSNVSDTPPACSKEATTVVGVCKGLTQTKKACKSKGRFEWDGLCYCKTHLPFGECSICLDTITSRSLIKLPCGHSFHAKCIRRWVTAEHVTCPMCRTPIADSVIDRLLPCAEESIETFVLDFQDMGQPTQADMERFIMNILNMHILGMAPIVD